MLAYSNLAEGKRASINGLITIKQSGQLQLHVWPLGLDVQLEALIKHGRPAVAGDPASGEEPKHSVEEPAHQRNRGQ